MANYDSAAAGAAALQGAQALRVWEEFGRPEALRSTLAKRRVSAFNPSILDFLAAGPTRFTPAGGASVGFTPPAPTPAFVAPTSGGIQQQTQPAPARPSVAWDDVSGTINTWRLGGVPVSWPTPGHMYGSLNDPGWWARYGADLATQVQTNPRVATYLQQNAPGAILSKLGLAPLQAPDPYDMPPRNIDLAAWGFGQRIDAPNLQNVTVDWRQQPRTIAPDSFATLNMSHLPQQLRQVQTPRTGTFLNVLEKAGTWATAPDAATVGRMYEDAINAANLTRLDEERRAREGALNTAVATRGLSGGTLGDTTNRAVDLWASREAARMRADTLPQRLALEQSLRGETNALTAQRAALIQALQAAENARLREAFSDALQRLQTEGVLMAGENERRRGDVALRSDLQQRQMDDFYRQLEARRALASDANQNAWARVGWRAQQNRQLQDEAMGLLNYLQSDAGTAVSPWQSVNALGDYASTMAGISNAAAERAAREKAAKTGLFGQILGTLGSVFGRGRIWK